MSWGWKAQHGVYSDKDRSIYLEDAKRSQMFSCEAVEALANTSVVIIPQYLYVSNQISTLYILNLHDIIGRLYLNEAGKF